MYPFKQVTTCPPPVNFQLIVQHNRVIPPNPNMPSLADRFSEYQRLIQLNQTESDVSQMTLEELGQERVGFGDAKKGMTYEEAFKDLRWTQYILRRYEKYETPSHLRFVKYVEMQLASQAKDSKQKPKNKTPEKPACSNVKELKTLPVDPADEWNELEEASSPLLLMEEIQDMRQSNQNLHNRMNNVEGMMEEIVQHLRHMNVKTET